MKLFKVKEKEYYYNISDINKTNATYRMIIGKRSNGKTFAVVNEIIKAYFDKKGGKPSVYVRRWDTDIRMSNPAMQNLFQPEHKALIKKLSKGQWNSVYFRSNRFRLSYEEDGETKKISESVILYTYSLNGWEHNKGGDLGPVHCLVYDEFLTRGSYLKDEFIIFANVISSIKRNREMIIYMLANSVNRYSPYWEEMGLYDIENQKKGSICVYTYNNSKLSVAVEYCSNSENTKETDYYFAFDNERLNMITDGDWEQANWPHLTKADSYTKDDIKFTFYVLFGGHLIKGIVYQKDGDRFIYFVPEVNHINIKEMDDKLVYCEKPSTKRNYAESFNYVSCKRQQVIYDLLRRKKVYYSSNTVGEIINNFANYNSNRRIG